MAKILVVEDNPAIRLVIQMTLTDEGHQVELRKNAPEALTLMKSGTIPDLVLTDLIMGEMSGRDLIKKMREDYQLRGIPAVIITGCIPDPDILPDTNDFQGLLLKPFDIDDLIALVANITSTIAA
jgi:CheY-like chemotaxis protein